MLGQVVRRDRYVHLTHAHYSDMDDVARLLDALRSLMDEGAPHRILADARHMHRDWSLADERRLMDLTDRAVPDGARVAIIATKARPDSVARMGQDLFSRKGCASARFTELNPALDWLLED